MTRFSLSAAFLILACCHITVTAAPVAFESWLKELIEKTKLILSNTASYVVDQYYVKNGMGAENQTGFQRVYGPAAPPPEGWDVEGPWWGPESQQETEFRRIAPEEAALPFDPETQLAPPDPFELLPLSLNTSLLIKSPEEAWIDFQNFQALQAERTSQERQINNELIDEPKLRQQQFSNLNLTSLAFDKLNFTELINSAHSQAQKWNITKLDGKDLTSLLMDLKDIIFSAAPNSAHDQTRLNCSALIVIFVCTCFVFGSFG